MEDISLPPPSSFIKGDTPIGHHLLIKKEHTLIDRKYYNRDRRRKQTNKTKERNLNQDHVKKDVDTARIHRDCYCPGLTMLRKPEGIGDINNMYLDFGKGEGFCL